MGVKFLVLRRRLRLTQEELSRRSGTSRRIIGLIENGRWEAVAFGKLARVAESLGARLYPNLTWEGEALDRLVDAGHAQLQNRVAGLLRSLGWMVAVEVSFNHYGDRGRYDILAFHPAATIILVVEIKTGIGDVQAMLGSIDVKVRLAALVARDLGWTGASVAVPALVIVDERNQHRIVALHGELFERFSVRGRSARAWLGDPRTSVSGLLVYVPMTHVRMVGVRHASRVRRVRHPASTSTTVPVAAQQSTLGPVRGP
jgi:transcriptional regulator with XRE-family HTH domain